MEGINRGNWDALDDDNTSPIPRANKVTDELLSKGIGPVDSAQIPIPVWDEIVPRDFATATEIGSQGVLPLRCPSVYFFSVYTRCS